MISSGVGTNFGVGGDRRGDEARSVESEDGVLGKGSKPAHYDPHQGAWGAL